MALTKTEVVQLYRRRAPRYDFTANLYYLLAFPEYRYRREAVSALQLRPGSRVLEIGCGTGLNFPLLERAVGPTGAVFGVDLTDAMLERAAERVRRARWANVHLARADAASYEPPLDLDGIISTFALALVPEFDSVVARGAAALAPGGRFVVLDLKKPDRVPMWLVRAGVALTRPFGISLDLADRHPWESLRRYLTGVTMTEYYGGFVYLCRGTAADT